MHILYMCETCLQSIEKKYWKPFGGVDFTKYALPTIFVYKQWSKMTKMKLEIGCKQGFQYTPRKIIWSWPITS